MMAEGNLVASYNALNQPVAMIPTGSPNIYWFGFDPLGRCVKRVVGPSIESGTATYFYYDEWNLIQEGPGATAIDRIYMLGNGVDEIVADYAPANGQWMLHHSEGRGHTMLLTNWAGNVAEQYEYDAFGRPYFFNAAGQAQTASNYGNRFLFTGREWLPEIKLYDYRNRMYQPELGRFMQPDPKEFAAGDYNLYRYCHNDPVNKSDPTGMAERIMEDFRWKMNCFFDGGNSFQGSYGEFMGNKKPSFVPLGGNYKDGNPKNHVKKDSEMGQDYGQTAMSRPKVTANADGSLSPKAELNWYVKDKYKLTAVSLAEINDHIRTWIEWSSTGDGSDAVRHFKATGSPQEAAAKLEKILRNEWKLEDIRQRAQYDWSQKHSPNVHPELLKGITPADIQHATDSLPSP
jgi:RHS repeat-associated protein